MKGQNHSCSIMQRGPEWLCRWGPEVSGGDLSRRASTYEFSTREVFKEDSIAEAGPGPSDVWPLLRPGLGLGGAALGQ